MLTFIKKSIQKSKVKSKTNRGDKAITRSYLYKEKGKNYIGIAFELLYLTDTETDDQLVRKCGDKYVYQRFFNMKLETLLESLSNLNVITGWTKEKD
jgi:hypothetical protein